MGCEITNTEPSNTTSFVCYVHNQTALQESDFSISFDFDVNVTHSGTETGCPTTKGSMITSITSRLRLCVDNTVLSPPPLMKWLDLKVNVDKGARCMLSKVPGLAGGRVISIDQMRATRSSEESQHGVGRVVIPGG